MESIHRNDRSAHVILAKILGCQTAEAAKALLGRKSVARVTRRKLAELAGLGSDWTCCDQSISANVRDMASQIVDELYIPFHFFRESLGLTQEATGERSGDRKSIDENPRDFFNRRIATRAMIKSKSGFWSASGSNKFEWLPGLDCHDSVATFDAVVHFVQEGVGTGVHVGNGLVVTCAHVIDSREDDGDDTSDVPDRVGRKKLCMFPSGRTFVSRCIISNETVDGDVDVAVMRIEAEIDVSASSFVSSSSSSPLPAAVVAGTAPKKGAKLFCVGNPSSIDLENVQVGSSNTEFIPSTWHASVGICEGYMSKSTQDLFHTQCRRALTGTELRKLTNAETVDATAGGYMLHTCWTYWGHSGAPLFDDCGLIVGLHCAWNDSTGMRHAQKLQNILDALGAATSA